VGVYFAELRVDNGYVITSVLNTRQDVEIPSLEVQPIELEDNGREVDVIGLTKQYKDSGDQSYSRGERVVERLRTDHLNDEKRSLFEFCFDYQDVFYLQGDRLSSTNAARYTTAEARSYPHKHPPVPVT
jgi:hypothetical protein